jgi:hypothetical protein
MKRNAVLIGSEFTFYEQKINLGKKISTQTCHFHMVINVGRNYLRQIS